MRVALLPLLCLAVLLQASPAPEGVCGSMSEGSASAYTALMQARGLDYAKHSTFIWALQRCRLEEVFRNISNGKVILVPTTFAMRTAFRPKGLFKGELSDNSNDFASGVGCADFRSSLANLVAAPGELPRDSGCWLLYSTKSVAAPLQNLLGSEPRHPGPDQRKVRAQGRSRPGTIAKYSVLGTGYNSYVAYPLSTGLVAMDPGFTLQQVFNLSDSVVATLSPTGGGCQTQYSSSTAYSLYDHKRIIEATLEVSFKTKKFGLSLSGEFGMVNTEMESNSRCSTTATAKVVLGGYTLLGKRIPLHRSFQDAVRRLSKGNPALNIPALNSFVDEYGTHFINRMFYGGLVAMTYTLDAAKKAQQDSLHIAVSISGTVSISVLPPITVKGSGGFDRNVVSNLSQIASEYSSVMLPSGVGPAIGYFQAQGPIDTIYTAYIDCSSWTQQLQQVFDSDTLQWTTPIAYSISPVTDVLGLPELFDADLRSSLPAIKAALTKFIESCAYSSSAALSIMQDPRVIDNCKSVSTKCVKGSYRPPASKGSCVTCFSSPSNSPFGPHCDWRRSVDCWWDPNALRIGLPEKGCCDAAGTALHPVTYESLGMPCPAKK